MSIFSMDIDKLVVKCFGYDMIQNKKEFTDLLEFLIELKPKNILEIGTYKGGTFYGFSQIATGKKISVDLPDGMFGGISVNDCIRRNLNMRKWTSNVIDILGNSRDVWIIDYVDDLLNGEGLDFIFIDGDHLYESVKADYELWSPLVNKNGWVGFHDINVHNHPSGCAVDKFWDKLKLEEKSKIEFIDENSNNVSFGIGLIQM